MRRREATAFYVFDVLWADGRDVRGLPLLERKRLLRSIVPPQPSVMLYARHVEARGKDFFGLACEQDLDGVVGKYKNGSYGEGWFKVRSPRYSQYEGRRELFQAKHVSA